MKPLVIITCPVHADAIELLLSVCNVARVSTRTDHARHALTVLASNAHALLATTPECVGESMLARCRMLRVVACAFQLPEHINVGACTRRGIWVTTVMSHRLGKDAEIEAARNILDVLGGDTPRGAVNEILQTAA